MFTDSPENLKLDPDSDIYYAGNAITCQANGNPKLQTEDYTWINLNNQSDITDGPVLTITQEMEGGCFAYQCQACNEYLDERYCTTLNTYFSVSGEC